MRVAFKKLRILAAGVLLLATAAYGFPKISSYFAAPKFTKIQYTHTEHIKADFCVLGPLACPHSDVYWYKSKGSQKVMAQAIMDKLKTKGYTLRPEFGVLCYGSAGDRYYLEQNQHIVLVSFYSKSPLTGGNTSEIGCKRPYAEYSISVDLN